MLIKYVETKEDSRHLEDSCHFSDDEQLALPNPPKRKLRIEKSDDEQSDDSTTRELERMVQYGHVKKKAKVPTKRRRWTKSEVLVVKTWVEKNGTQEFE